MNFLEGCPWYGLAMNFPPNVRWNEAYTCSLAITPNNALTNIAYVIFALIILGKEKTGLLRFFGWAVMATGITSLIFHSTLNLFTQMLDFLGMYIFTNLLLMINLIRTNKWPKPALKYYWLSVAGMMALTIVMYFLHLPYQALVFILIIGIIVTEFINKPHLDPAIYKGTSDEGINPRTNFYISMALMAVAATFSALDQLHKVSSPDNHYFQGHGAWHVLTACALCFYYLHYTQFREALE